MKESPSIKHTWATIMFMVVFLLSVTVIDFIILSSQDRTYRENADNRARSEMELVATFVTEPLLRYQFSNIEQFILQWGEKNEDVSLFRAVTPTGNTLAEYRRPAEAIHTLSLNHQVIFEGQHLLDLEMIKDLGSMDATLLKLKRQLVVQSFVTTGIIGLALWIILKLLALRPLEAEIGLRRLAEEKLQGANEDLEDRVTERTLALTETNSRLESEIAVRYRTEKLLAAEKENLAVTLRSIGDGVITTDIEGRVVLLNRVAEHLTGWTQEEAAGRSLTEVFFIVDKRTRKRCEDPVSKVLETGKIVALANHTALISRDGTERVIADSGAPIRDSESRSIGVVLVFRDVTEKAMLEEELSKVQKLESVGVLAGGIAHDFNNILTAVLGNITLAAYQISPEEKPYPLLMAAEKATIRAKDLTQQLLTFAKGGEPVREAASAEDIIRDSASFVLLGGNVKCLFTIPEDLWLVDVDRGQISQVIQNVIINARQAMPEGGTIEIACDNYEKKSGDPWPLKEGRYVRVTVRDRGVGIPENIIGKIFDPFYSTKQEGSGLGLAVTHSIITKHTGHIAVESKPGEGSLFTFFLPATEKPIEKETAGEGENGSAETGRVLVMDDEEAVRQIVQSMLSHYGYEVVTSAGGAEAVDLFRRSLEAGEGFDVVILDLTVPGGMGGQDAVKEILTLDPEARVVVSSGYSNDPIIAHYRDYGFKGAIIKPFKMSELRGVVRKVIG